MILGTSSSPHHTARRSTQIIMQLVMLAAIPGLLAQWYFFGWGVVIQLALAIVTCVGCEALVLALRKKPVVFVLNDYSAVLTGWLLAICLPPLLPWWMTVIGCVFAIVIAKQLYGGLGFNIFNPAMIGYVVLLISFPAQMSQWLPVNGLAELSPSLLDSLSVIFTGFTVSGHDIEQLRYTIDGVTSATPLDSVRTAITLNNTYSDAINSPVFNGGLLASWGAGWGWISAFYLLGGIALIMANIINWRIPVSVLVGVAITATVLNLLNGDLYGSAVYHWFNGAVMVGAFFIATDPVSASTTAKGKVVFGALIGFWIVIIRTFGGYPDAVAFSILFLNMSVPLIDYYTQPRTYGHSTKNRAENSAEKRKKKSN
ncbi:electron transport complex subunit RsxD [Alteromonas sp. 5E99-2]|uniref:electron transport complex subunit RsxD n=1 Tax=Alteromonas sp. 5E99-2 TaxID=2817683 RepID=UPI001A99DC8F|nr:electron transport complex subunit RsxD [Alteromonas sp. 5E99-2]MBO1256030.1 electron transport complex subunit RsxD [Alteromonas sp. 5E99-2]